MTIPRMTAEDEQLEIKANIRHKLCKLSEWKLFCVLVVANYLLLRKKVKNIFHFL